MAEKTYTINVILEPLRFKSLNEDIEVDVANHEVSGMRADSMIYSLGLYRNGARATWNQKSRYSYQVKFEDDEDWSEFYAISYNASGCTVGCPTDVNFQIRFKYSYQSTTELSPIYTCEVAKGTVLYDNSIILTSTTPGLVIDNEAKTVSGTFASTDVIEIAATRVENPPAWRNSYLFFGNQWLRYIHTDSYYDTLTASNLATVSIIRPVVRTTVEDVNQWSSDYTVNITIDDGPRMNITSADQAVSITPTTFNVSKAATGEAPYNTSGNYNYLALSLAYGGTWDQNYYRIEVFDSSSVSIYDTPTYAGSSNLPSILGVPITSGDVGTGKYLTITIFSGTTAQSQSTAVNTIRIDTSALTLEAAPTPPTPSYPDFGGMQTGDFEGFTMFEMSTNQTTYYEFDPNSVFESANLAYVNTTTSDGHTVYQYEATLGYDNNCYIKYLDPLLNSYSCRNVNTNSTIWLFTRTPTISGASVTSGVYEYGGQLSNVMSGTSFPCNAFYCISNSQRARLGDYHYTRDGSQISPERYLDIFGVAFLVFATKGDSTTIPSTPIEFKLYNSTGSDYILISIDMSNITASQYS